MTETKFPLYRSQEASRVTVNDAMMAVLAGSRLASHTLKLTEGSTTELSKIFPAVEHIGRFNLRTDKARSLLGAADRHIASVAVPYALAAHEGFITDLIDMTCSEAQVTRPSTSASNMHEKFFELCKAAKPDDELEVFHVLRELRNCIIHSQGVDTQGRLRDKIRRAGAGARQNWSRINGGSDMQSLVAPGGEVDLQASHIFTAFAISKALARKANEAITHFLPRETWAKIALEDYSASTSKLRNSSAWRRAALGYVNRNYAPVGLTGSEIEDCSRRMGLWTAARWE